MAKVPDAGMPPISDAFAGVYKTAPNGVGTGYGRVNIIGEHTDYNDGFVMPCILNHRTDVAVSIRTDRQLRGESTAEPPSPCFTESTLRPVAAGR